MPWADHGQRREIEPPELLVLGADDEIRPATLTLARVIGKVQVDAYKSLTWAPVWQVVHCVQPVQACRIALHHDEGGIFRQGDATPGTILSIMLDLTCLGN